MQAESQNNSFGTKELSSMMDMVDQSHDTSFLSSQMDLEYKLPPLYKRVLTALIIDDEETGGDENISFLYERDDPSEDELLKELQIVGIYLGPVATPGATALPFKKRTLTRCRTFKEFLDPRFKDGQFATPSLDNHTVSSVPDIQPLSGSHVPDIRPLAQNSRQDFAPPGSFPSSEQSVLGNSNHPSNLDFARTSNSLGGENGKVLPDDVGASASLGVEKEKVLPDDVGASASLGVEKEKVLLGVDSSASLEGKKTRKKSKRGTNKDTSTRNYVKRGGRSSASNTRSERKTKAKAKAKPKTDRLSTAKGSLGKSVENTDSTVTRVLACGSDQLVTSGNNNVGSVSHGYSTNDLAIETEDPLDLTNMPDLDSTNMPELDSVDVGADKDLGSWLNIDEDDMEDAADKDLGSWLNIDEDDMEDAGDVGGLDMGGLDIPMDDLFTVF